MTQRDPTFQISIRRNRKHIASARVVERTNGFEAEIDWPIFDDNIRKLDAILLCILATAESHSELGKKIREVMKELGLYPQGKSEVELYFSPSGEPLEADESSGDLPF